MVTKPDYHQHEEFVNRSRKLRELREHGVEPYPHKYSPRHHAQELSVKYAEETVGHSEDASAGTTDQVCVAGRLILFRAMGKNAFAHLQDGTGRIQLMFNRDATVVEGYDPSSSNDEAPKPLKFLEKMFDLGDIIGVEGHLFRTQKGELTILVKKATMLCKSLLPLPEKHSGLVDKEQRYRKRWLDLIDHADVAKVFRTRTRILQLVRHHFEENHFQEVETPVLVNVYGGAAAKPFATHHNALEQDCFLRISLEIPLKKLIVGGLERVFEIGKVFRNEGIDRTHNPEFTLMEAYAAYWDYNDLMTFMETLIEKVAIDLHGGSKVSYDLGDGDLVELDFKTPWKRMTMKESIKEYTGHDVDNLSADQMREILGSETEVAPDVLKPATRGTLIALLFDEKVTGQLMQPIHITDHPVETTPLCKPHRNAADREAGLIERFESFVAGNEIINAYSELNDPELQRQLREAEQALAEERRRSAMLRRGLRILYRKKMCEFGQWLRRIAAAQVKTPIAVDCCG